MILLIVFSSHSWVFVLAGCNSAFSPVDPVVTCTLHISPVLKTCLVQFLNSQYENSLCTFSMYLKVFILASCLFPTMCGKFSVNKFLELCYSWFFPASGWSHACLIVITGAENKLLIKKKNTKKTGILFHTDLLLLL